MSNHVNSARYILSISISINFVILNLVAVSTTRLYILSFIWIVLI